MALLINDREPTTSRYLCLNLNDDLDLAHSVDSILFVKEMCLIIVIVSRFLKTYAGYDSSCKQSQRDAFIARNR